MTAEFPDQFVVHVDGESRDIVASLPGPAGVSSIEVGPELLLTVDHAAPELLCTVSIGGALTDSSVVFLERLLGAERAASALAAGADRPTLVAADPDADGPTSARPPVSSLGQTGRAPGTVATAAVLESLADDHTRSELARGVAHLERAHLLRGDLEWLDPDDQMASAAIASAKELIEDALTGDLYGVVDAVGAKQLLMLGLFRAHPDPALERLLSEVALVRPTRRRDRGSVTFEREPQVVLRPNGRLTVSAVDAVGAWARVIHARSQVLLALVPMLHYDNGWHADAVIPPDLVASDLSVEVSAVPLLRERGVLTDLDRMRAAVRAGRRAVELRAVGGRAGNRRRWNECAALWREFGDQHRAALAEQCATSGPPRRALSLSERVEGAQYGGRFSP